MEDFPKDFISLCEFLTKWNDELIFEFPEIIPVLYEGEAVNKSNLIRMAVQYYIRYMVATGKDLTFDTPLFRKMAYALEKVKTDNIDAMLGNLDDDEVYDLSPLMEYGMPFQALWTNDAYTYLEIKPTQDSESIASVNLHMVAVNACSTNPELSAEFALDVLKTVVADNRFLIFADATDPLEDTGIKRSIEEIEEKIALVREMMKTSDNPEYAEMLSGWESELQDLQQHIWTVSPEEINYFRQDIAPHISIQIPNIFDDSDGNSSGEMWSLVQRWQDGQIDTEQFIRIAEKNEGNMKK